MSHQQKQQLLDQLSQYLGGADSLRAVMNSPCLDRRGAKMLGFDGNKVITSTDAGGFRRGWNKKRGRNQKDNKGNKNSNQNGPNTKGGPSNKKKKSNKNVSCFWPKPFLISKFFLNFPIQGSNSNSGTTVWCKYHCERVGNHTPETCFLNRKSPQFRGEEFVKEFEQKNQRKVPVD